MARLSGGEIEAMKMLIDAGHPVHVADRWGGTPLHSAAEMGQAEAQELHGHPVVATGHVVQHGHPPLDLEAEQFPFYTRGFRELKSSTFCDFDKKSFERSSPSSAC